MSQTQYFEDLEYSLSARYDRFDGFDRGDLDNDPDEEQRAWNEYDESQFSE